MGQIRFCYRKLKAYMKKFEKSKIKGKEKYENVAIIVQEPSSYEIEL